MRPALFTRARFRAAARALAGVAHTMPVLSSQTFSRMAGCPVKLKCENLQRTGSFKVRGAAVRMRALVAATEGYGARVILHGDSFDDAPAPCGTCWRWWPGKRPT